MIYFHNKIHLAIFNTFISSGVFVIARTILHMKTLPEEMFDRADKLVGLICLVLVVADFNELFFSTTIMPPVSMTELKYKQETAKLEAGKKELQEKAKNYFKNNGTTFNPRSNEDSIFQGIKPANRTISTIESPKDLPTMVPVAWLSHEEATSMGYQKSINHQNAIDRIRFNEPLIGFTISNTRKDRPSYLNSLEIRIENPLLRLRIFFYNILLISLTHMPVFLSSIIIVCELIFVIYIAYTVCKYRYLENWFFIGSRINVSLAFIGIAFIALIIGLTQDKQIGSFKDVSPVIQYAGIAVVIFCLVFEFIFTVIMVVVMISRTIYNKFCKK